MQDVGQVADQAVLEAVGPGDQHAYLVAGQAAGLRRGVGLAVVGEVEGERAHALAPTATSAAR